MSSTFPSCVRFISPAVVNRGELQIAISTGGASPAFAARLRRALEDQFGTEYALTLEVLRAARRRLHAEEIDPADRMRRLKELANSALPDAIAAGDVAAIERILATHLGDGVGLAALGLDRRIAWHRDGNLSLKNPMDTLWLLPALACYALSAALFVFDRFVGPHARDRLRGCDPWRRRDLSRA